jgi:predicted transcriptional regulator
MSRTPTAPVAEMDEEERAAYLAAADEGIAEADAGKLIPYERIRRWLLSWGTDDELPPPK